MIILAFSCFCSHLIFPLTSSAILRTKSCLSGYLFLYISKNNWGTKTINPTELDALLGSEHLQDGKQKLEWMVSLSKRIVTMVPHSLSVHSLIKQLFCVCQPLQLYGTEHWNKIEWLVGFVHVVQIKIYYHGTLSRQRTLVAQILIL